MKKLQSPMCMSMFCWAPQIKQGPTFPSCLIDFNVDNLDNRIGQNYPSGHKKRKKIHESELWEQQSGKLVLTSPSLMSANNNSLQLMCEQAVHLSLCNLPLLLACQPTCLTKVREKKGKGVYKLQLKIRKAAMLCMNMRS